MEIPAKRLKNTGVIVNEMSGVKQLNKRQWANIKRFENSDKRARYALTCTAQIFMSSLQSAART